MNKHIIWVGGNTQTEDGLIIKKGIVQIILKILRTKCVGDVSIIYEDN